jgi:hypothetical protein
MLTGRKVMQHKCIDLENEIRGLLKVFGVKMPLRLSRGAFDRAVRDTIESDAALSYALLPMLQARRMLFATFTELDPPREAQGPRGCDLPTLHGHPGRR